MRFSVNTAIANSLAHACVIDERLRGNELSTIHRFNLQILIPSVLPFLLAPIAPGHRQTTKIFLALILSFSTGCHRATPTASGPLTQRGYLWQRAWNSAVTVALAQAETRLDGVVILGAEIVWSGRMPQTIRATIDWETLKNSKKPVAIALRVAPFPGPFEREGVPVQHIAETAKSLLATASAHGMKLSEFQLDFDCAEKKLSGYRQWLHALRPNIRPVRFVITTLPAWLDQPEFPALVHEVDGYVLQVHSVPTFKESGRTVLCDAALARKWVNHAAELKLPFSVALPTYRCLAGYDSAGKLLSVAMDSVEPAWPPDTHVLEFATDADDLARLVNGWQTARPPELLELLWYRVPVATDIRNWRWATLSAVMAGRAPVHKLEVATVGDNPVDLSISNVGEADNQQNIVVTVTWNSSSLVACDALPGWTVRTERESAIFTPTAGFRTRLPPGGQRSIGWLRYDQVTTVRSQVEELTKAPF
jgi:hypothetical protein